MVSPAAVAVVADQALAAHHHHHQDVLVVVADVAAPHQESAAHHSHSSASSPSSSSHVAAVPVVEGSAAVDQADRLVVRVLVQVLAAAVDQDALVAVVEVVDAVVDDAGTK